MIGPTGVGKTEIARRLARLADAPFIKVEATKFTEVGYVGRDVDSIIRDLAEVAVKMTREQEIAQGARPRAPTPPRSACSTRCCRKPRDAGLLDRRAGAAARCRDAPEVPQACCARASSTTRRSRSRCARCRARRRDHGAARAWRRCTQQLQAHVRRTSAATRTQARASVKVARGAEAADRGGSRASSSTRRSSRRARCTTPSRTASCSSTRSTRSRAAQRDAAAPTSRARACSATCCRWSRARPSPPSTAWSRPTTSCSSPSGAFHFAKPSDLIPELQGRFPIRVELDSLSVDDFERILTEPDACADRAVPGAARHRGRDARVHARRRAAHRRDRLRRSTSAPRTSARAACTR